MSQYMAEKKEPVTPRKIIQLREGRRRRGRPVKIILLAQPVPFLRVLLLAVDIPIILKASFCFGSASAAFAVASGAALLAAADAAPSVGGGALAGSDMVYNAIVAKGARVATKSRIPKDWVG